MKILALSDVENISLADGSFSGYAFCCECICHVAVDESLYRAFIRKGHSNGRRIKQ